MRRFLIVALVIGSLMAGALLRLSFVHDMEYKEDEELNFTHSQVIGTTQPWPWIGMPSGVYIANPGMSYWVFAALAKVSGARTPTDLARALQLFSLLGISLLIPFAYRFVRESEREPWLWAFALAMVNPILILYQRKLWPQPFLPFFTVLMLMGWWRRSSFWGAFVWGLVGALLGQIHMSGFFFAAGFFIWEILFGRKRPGAPAHWKGWFAGSVLGALPLIPWAFYVLNRPLGGNSVTSGWVEPVQLKFWVFWFSNPIGMHLGNPLGLLRGNSNFAQLSDFIRYPLVGGHPTYLTGLAHLVILGIALWLIVRAIRYLRETRMSWKEILTGLHSPHAFAIASAFWAFGLTMTLTSVNIRRYYMMVAFPLDFAFFTFLAFACLGRFSRPALAALWCAELFISANFVGYIHVNEGSMQGDYGPAYHVVMKKRAQSGQ